MTEPDPAEWDFRDIPDSEVIACYQYEFAREYARQVPALKAKVEEFRRSEARAVELAFKSSTDDIVQKIRPYLGSANRDTLHYHSFLWYPEWPDTVYVAIDEKSRSDRVKISAESLKPSDAEMAPLTTYLHDPPKLSSEGSYDAMLKEAFAALRRIPRVRPRGRAGGLAPQRQALQELGFYRLLNKNAVKEVAAFLKTRKCHPLANITDRALRRIKGKAAEAIETFGNDAISNLENGRDRHLAFLTAALHSRSHFSK